MISSFHLPYILFCIINPHHRFLVQHSQIIYLRSGVGCKSRVFNILLNNFYTFHFPCTPFRCRISTLTFFVRGNLKSETLLPRVSNFNFPHFRSFTVSHFTFLAFGLRNCKTQLPGLVLPVLPLPTF